VARRPDWIAAILVTVAIAALHAYFWAHAGGLWRDEVNVVNLAGTDSLSWMTRDSFPVLLPLLIKGWSALGLGGSDGSLRLEGVVTGLGLAGALWLAAWTGRRSAPLLSLVLLGLNGTIIFWSDSLRAFGLGSVLIVLALGALCWLLEKPTWTRAAILAAAASLSVQALYQNAVLVAALAFGGWLVCWFRRDRKTAGKILLAGVAAALSLLPYWGCVAKWSTATNVVRPGFSWMAATGNFNTVAAFPLPQFVWIWKALWLLVVVLGVAAFFRRPRESAARTGCLTAAEARVLAGGILLASLAGYLCFLYFAALITEPWYFLPLFALAAVCFDLGIAIDPLPRIGRVILFGGVAATSVIAIVFGLRDLNCRLTNIDLVAGYLRQNLAPQDYVVVTPWYMGITFDRYYRGPAPWDTLPPIADHSTHRFDLLPASTNAAAQAMQPVYDHIAGTLQGGHRVWVVGSMSLPPPGRKAHTQESQFIADHSQSFISVDLKLKGQTSDFEEASLLRADGWKTNSLTGGRLQ
jgi:hypothetical protein